MGIIDAFIQFSPTLLEGIKDTLYMSFVTLLIAYFFGTFFGITLYVTARDGIATMSVVNKFLGSIINALRSIPFIILMVMLIPLTRQIIGTAIGTTAAIVPLSFAATPFIARIVEVSLNEIDKGVIDAALSMGATKLQIIIKVIIPESIPSLIRGSAIVIINLIGLSAMAGAIGAGGLGHLAIRYGHQRGQSDIMFIIVLVIIVLVAIIQFLLDFLAKKIDKKNI